MQERIGAVKPETGKFGERLVLTFDPSGKMLSLNKTSVGNLLRDFGEDDSGWINQKSSRRPPGARGRGASRCQAKTALRRGLLCAR
jgi:hypothetical protein